MPSIEAPLLMTDVGWFMGTKNRFEGSVNPLYEDVPDGEVFMEPGIVTDETEDSPSAISPFTLTHAYKKIHTGEYITLQVPQDRYGDLPEKELRIEGVDDQISYIHVISELKKFYHTPMTTDEIKEFTDADCENQWALEQFPLVCRHHIMGDQLFVEGIQLVQQPNVYTLCLTNFPFKRCLV
jgi:hypothetical protein